MQSSLLDYSILIIEDNVGDFFLIEDYLHEFLPSFEIYQAPTFSKAKEMLASKDRTYDVILLDLSLTDNSGKKLIDEAIEASGNNIPIIILTGYSSLDFAIKSLTIGVADYLIKDELTPIALRKSILYAIERHKILLNLKESEHRYADLFHLSPQPMWVYDAETLAFLDVNEAAIRHYGYSYDEFLNMSIKDIKPLEDLPLLQAALVHNSYAHHYLFQTEFRHIKKNGEIIIMDLKSTSILYRGRPAKIILAHDITANKKYLEEIEHQNQKLREIAWVQSHVVRAPLARLLGLTQLLNEEDLSPQEYKQYLKELHNSASELDIIVRNIVKKTNELQLTK